MYSNMKTQTVLLAALASTVLGNPETKTCQTVTETRTPICSTCNVLACLAYSTVTPGNCPGGVMPTTTVEYPCPARTCPTGCGSTSYIYRLTISDPTVTVPVPTTTDGPGCRPPKKKWCVPTVTHTTYPGTAGGCEFDCSDSFCVRDDILTLPCGCDQAKSVVTRTKTICPTSSPCYNCHTGYMYTTTASNCKK